MGALPQQRINLISLKYASFYTLLAHFRLFYIHKLYCHINDQIHKTWSGYTKNVLHPGNEGQILMMIRANKVVKNVILYQ